MSRKVFYFEIFAVSLAAILLEISYTRIFSFKVLYYFTYLIIGIALMGLGAGGVFVAVSRRLRQADPAQLISGLCFLAGAGVLFGYLVIATTQLNISVITPDPAKIPKLVGVCLMLAIPFLMCGIIISTILSTYPEAAGRLYGADLLGASLGCVSCIPLLVILDPPRTVMLAGVIFTIGGLRSALHSRLRLVIGGMLGLAMIVPIVFKELLPDPIADAGKTHSKFRENMTVLFSKWHPVFRVDVVTRNKKDNLYLLYHDGTVGSGLHRFDGDSGMIEYLRSDERALPFEILPDKPKVLIIGAAGGQEILASLLFNASHVTAVELNPVTVSLLTDTFADYSGRLGENPRVKLINGDGRWFVKQDEDKYDLIWFVAPDSYAAMNATSAASFVLAESYLYTVEMLTESLRHLTDQGLICAQFGEIDFYNKPNRTTRYVATARQAFADEGIENFNQHVAVTSSSSAKYGFSVSTILLSKSPLAFDRIKRFQAKIKQMKNTEASYLPNKMPDSSPINQVVIRNNTHLEEWYKTYRYQVDPIYDDSPYFWHFARFRDAIASPLDVSFKVPDAEDSIAERVSVTLLTVATILAALFLFLPFLAIHKIWREIPYKIRAAVYFASLGLGFMFIEIPLIQMFTLFLGYPTHSLTVTLFGLLLFSGIGSLISQRYSDHRNRAVAVLFGLLAGLVLAYQFGLPFIVDHFVGRSLPFRILLTIIMIAPLGLSMGAFMPIGLMTVATTTPYKREYVAWAWAVNGFFSVMASILSTILAMIFGFKLVLLLALAIYAAGVLSLMQFPKE